MENLSQQPATVQVNRFFPLHSCVQVVLKSAFGVKLYDSHCKLSLVFSSSDERVGVDLYPTARGGVGRRVLEHLDPNEVLEKNFVPIATEFVEQPGLGEYQIALSYRRSRMEEFGRQGDGYLAPTDLSVLGATTFGHLELSYDNCIQFVITRLLYGPIQ